MAIDLNLLEIEGKREEYRKYIQEHVMNVQKVWSNIIIDKDLREIINNKKFKLYEDIISTNIGMHDLSKYSEEEFEPYRKNFFPINDKEKEENLVDFQMAWQHHKDNNKHHWDYWSERGLTNDMPYVYVVEMFCDHAAMSIKFGGTALEWMKNQLNNNKIKIGEKQKEWYFELAEAYYSKYK